MSFYSFNGDNTDAMANSGYTLDFFHVATESRVSFKAFLTSLSDNYESEWEKEDIYGRMDSIQTFKSTKRTISVGWDVVAGSIEEAQTNMVHLSELFNMLYPVYEGRNNNTSAMSHAPLLRMKFANLIANSSKGQGDVKESGLLGSASGFNFEPAVDDLMFADDDGNLYPKIVKLSCTFSVIHEHSLGWSGGSKREGSFPYGDFQTEEQEGDMTFTQEEVERSEQEERREAQKAQSILDDFRSSIIGGGGVRK